MTNLFLEAPAPTPSLDPGLHPAHDFTAGVYGALGLTAGMCNQVLGGGKCWTAFSEDAGRIFLQWQCNLEHKCHGLAAGANWTVFL